MADKEFSFDDLNKEMSKGSLLGERLDKSDVSTVDHYIHTGNYMLNACMTGSLSRGIPNNRAIALAGPSGTGKTFLLLNAIKQAQDMGYYIVFYDSENSVDRELVERFGIDPSRFRYEPVGTVQEFRTSVTNLTELLIEKKKNKMEIPKILIALDSAGNLATQKEIDDAASGSEKADMTRAKVLKSIFRILIHRLAIIKAPFIFTNHTYLTQSMYAQTVSGGGCLVPGSKVLMYDGGYKNIENIIKGDKVKTLDGSKDILETFTFEKKTYEVEFEDGSKIQCSEDHRFYIGGDYLDDSSWINVKDLKSDDTVLQFKY